PIRDSIRSHLPLPFGSRAVYTPASSCRATRARPANCGKSERLHARALVLKIIPKRLVSHGLAEEKSLAIVATLLTQEIQLVVLLHTFGHHLNVESLRHS